MRSQKQFRKMDAVRNYGRRERTEVLPIVYHPVQGWANFLDRGSHSASLGPWRAAQCVLGSLAGRIHLNQVKIRGSCIYFYRGCRSI